MKDGMDRTRISDIVRELEALREEHGDLPILIDKGPGDNAYVGTRTFNDGAKYAVIGLSHTRSVGDRDD